MASSRLLYYGRSNLAASILNLVGGYLPEVGSQRLVRLNAEGINWPYDEASHVMVSGRLHHEHIMDTANYLHYRNR